MSEQEQIKALAELDGWTKNDASWFSPNGGAWAQRRSGGKEVPVVDILPPYLTSYDAIIPLIEKIVVVQSIKVNFLNSLREILSHEQEGPISDYAMIVARPEQLCEAILKATDKWT